MSKSTVSQGYPAIRDEFDVWRTRQLDDLDLPDQYGKPAQRRQRVTPSLTDLLPSLLW